MITRETIERIRDAADIVEVVGDFVSLKRKGRNYMACCPFHSEKTPSFSVAPDKGIYKCFGCGEAGDSINFVMKADNLTYVEALRYLAKKYSITVEEEQGKPVDDEAERETESLHVVMNFANRFFKEKLLQSDEGKSIGLSYLQERGFTDKAIETFELGYSPEARTALRDEALRNAYKEELLEKAGLITKGDYGVLDRFRGRVMFPIHSVAGKVIAFGARTLKKEKNIPKYLNSPETPLYHKSEVLYGLFQAKNDIRKLDNCYLVEGYTDVISLHQAGISNVVASSGTSLTVEQIKQIKRFSDRVTVLYDGDSAGIKASLRGIDLLLEEGMKVMAVLFPDGEDPDSYLRRVGGEAFQQYLNAHKKDFITFKTGLYLSEIEHDPIRRAEVIRDIVQSISKISDAIQRQVFFRECARLLDISEDSLVTEYNKMMLAKRRDKPSNDNVPDPVIPIAEVIPEFTPPLLNRERELVRLLLMHGDKALGETDVATYLYTEIEDPKLESGEYDEILSLAYKEWQNGNIINDDYFIRQADVRLQRKVIDLVTEQVALSPGWEKLSNALRKYDEDLPQVAYSCVMSLKRERITARMKANRAMIKTLEEQLRNVGTEEAKEALNNALQMNVVLQETLAALGSLTGTVVTGKI